MHKISTQPAQNKVAWSDLVMHQITHAHVHPCDFSSFLLQVRELETTLANVKAECAAAQAAAASDRQAACSAKLAHQAAAEQVATHR